MARLSDYDFGVEGPVQAEVFVLWLGGGHIMRTGPCGPDPWYLELGEDDDPVDTVTLLVRSNVGEPVVVHSTSWRRSRDAVILTFVVVVNENLGSQLESDPVARAELARNTATGAPPSVDTDQVIEHGLRHLAWLALEDPVVSESLSAEWVRVLSAYEPQPFRNLR